MVMVRSRNPCSYGTEYFDVIDGQTLQRKPITWRLNVTREKKNLKFRNIIAWRQTDRLSMLEGRYKSFYTERKCDRKWL